MNPRSQPIEITIDEKQKMEEFIRQNNLLKQEVENLRNKIETCNAKYDVMIKAPKRINPEYEFENEPEYLSIRIKELEFARKTDIWSIQFQIYEKEIQCAAQERVIQDWKQRVEDYEQQMKERIDEMNANFDNVIEEARMLKDTEGLRTDLVRVLEKDIEQYDKNNFKSESEKAYAYERVKIDVDNSKSYFKIIKEDKQ